MLERGRLGIATGILWRVPTAQEVRGCCRGMLVLVLVLVLSMLAPLLQRRRRVDGRTPSRLEKVEIWRISIPALIAVRLCQRRSSVRCGAVDAERGGRVRRRLERSVGRRSEEGRGGGVGSLASRYIFLAVDGSANVIHRLRRTSTRVVAR